MARNITRLPLPSSTFGRSTCVLTQDLAPALRQAWSSRLPRNTSARLLESLPLPLKIVEAQCECGALLDEQGRHRAACPRSGRLRSRAVGPERTLARVCREAGATVRCNVRLRDMNVAVSATDMRSIEVLAIGLPLHHGAQLAVDITLRSALTSASMRVRMRPLLTGPCWSRLAPTRNVSTLNLSTWTAAVWWLLASKLEAVGVMKQ